MTSNPADLDAAVICRRNRLVAVGDASGVRAAIKRARRVVVPTYRPFAIIALNERRERVANILRDYFGTFCAQLSTMAPFRSQITFSDRAKKSP